VNQSVSRVRIVMENRAALWGTGRCDQDYDYDYD